MTEHFFPSPALAWVYVVCLAISLAAASIIDGRSLRIPKPLSIGLLGAGLVASLVRGSWLGQLGRAVCFFTASGPILGACDALLLSLGCVVLGFVLFFVFWMVGICGGGDVKLFAALAAWIDPQRTLLIAALSLTIVCLLVMAAWAGKLVRGPGARTRAADRASATGDGPIRGRRISYSLPLAIATATVLILSWSAELFDGGSLLAGQSRTQLPGVRR